MGKSSKFFLEDLVAKPPLRVKTHQIIFIFLFFWPWGGRMGWFTTPDQLSGWLHPLDQNGGGSADPHFFFQFFFLKLLFFNFFYIVPRVDLSS
jgi:hypothetical protein